MMGPNNLSQMFTSMLLLPAAVGTLSGFLVIYILNWLRGMRDERDPLLGGKVIYTMLFTLGFQVVLSGVGQLVPAIIENDSGDMNGMQYMQAMDQTKPLAQPLALITSGALIGLYGLGMIYSLSRRGVGDSQIFLQGLGINAASTGLISCLGLITWTSTLFRDGFEFGDQLDVIWVMFTYFLGHMFCVLPLIKMVPEEDVSQVLKSSSPADAASSPEPASDSEPASDADST